LLPWQWWLLGAIPLGIILLYFLKLRREPVEVPSTFLWARTIEDLHVNSLIQRLRKNLLLFLQLLAVLLAALALLRPGSQGETSGQGRSVFLLDTSASMGATDVEGFANRFEKARELIKERINAMSDTDEAMLVSFSDRPAVLQSFTADRGRLRDALSRAQLTSRPTDVMGALKAADGLANPRRTSEAGDAQDVQVADAMPADLLIFSDGGFQTASQRTLQVGEETNLAILSRWMLDVGYQPSQAVRLRSEFQQSDEQLEVFPPTGDALDDPVRIRFSGDTVASIQSYDVESGAAIKNLTELTLPALDLIEDPISKFNLGYLSPKYVAIGSDGVKNLGIIAFSAERNFDRPSEVQAFATVVNMGSQPASAVGSLYVEDAFYEASAIELQPGQQVGLSFVFESDTAASLELKLEGEDNSEWKDDLALDNVAYAGLTPLRTVSVLVVTPGNKPLKVALETESAGKICVHEFVPPSFMETEDYQQRATAGVDDLIIYDRCTPKEMPPTNTFFIGALPVKGWSWDSEPQPMVLIDFDRTHPIMRYVELYSLLIVSGRGLKGPNGTADLVGSDIGTALAIAPRDGYQDLVLGFEIVSTGAEGEPEINTNWYAERAWPVFMFNVLRYLAGAAEASGAPSFRPGETVRLRVESALSDVQISRVGDKGDKYTTGPSGTIEFVNTDQPGNYRVEAEERLADLFAVNLFDRRESDISAAPTVDLGYEEVGATVAGIERRNEYWRWLLMAMLGLLAAEWWIYSKRVA
jgi:hypothetical protein